MPRLLLVALSTLTVANGQATTDEAQARRPWQEFMSHGINTGLNGMNKGLQVGLGAAEGQQSQSPGEITQQFTSFGAESAQGFGNLASGKPVGATPGAGATPPTMAAASGGSPSWSSSPYRMADAGTKTAPFAAAPSAAPASTLPGATAGTKASPFGSAPSASVPPGTLEGMGGDTPFIDNSAFLPTNTKAHLGSEQEFLNAAALTSINFGNLAHKHANLFGQGKGNGQLTAQDFSQEGVNTANRFIMLSGPLGTAVQSANNSPEIQPTQIHAEPRAAAAPAGHRLVTGAAALLAGAVVVAGLAAARMARARKLEGGEHSPSSARHIVREMV